MHLKGKRVVLIVLDGVGIGGSHDARLYGDEGSNTLGNVLLEEEVLLPNLQSLGLGNLGSFRGVRREKSPRGSYGIITVRSPGKDTVTGHWEMMGIILEEAFPVFPEGFPQWVMEEFVKETGVGYLWNKPASGTEIIETLGREHMRTGKVIVYTSADSVFQIASHTSVLSLERLYSICEVTRNITDPLRILRVIARPFAGAPGSFTRTSDRRDFPLSPPGPTVVDYLNEEGVEVISVGKVAEMFGGRGFYRNFKTKGNREGVATLVRLLEEVKRGFIFVNLNDYDMLYGHRNDVRGFANALKEFDDLLPGILELLDKDDLLMVSADHGNDPTFPGTDHTRERVFLLSYKPGREGVMLGDIDGFAHLGATVLHYYGINGDLSVSPLKEVL